MKFLTTLLLVACVSTSLATDISDIHNIDSIKTAKARCGLLPVSSESRSINSVEDRSCADYLRMVENKIKEDNKTSNTIIVTREQPTINLDEESKLLANLLYSMQLSDFEYGTRLNERENVLYVYAHSKTFKYAIAYRKLNMLFEMQLKKMTPEQQEEYKSLLRSKYYGYTKSKPLTVFMNGSKTTTNINMKMHLRDGKIIFTYAFQVTLNTESTVKLDFNENSVSITSI